MPEVLGKNLKNFFDNVDQNYTDAEIVYANDRYEVWWVTGKLFDRMCNMTEKEFRELSNRDDAWMRSSDGCNLNSRKKGDFTVNGIGMIGWKNKTWQDDDKEYDNCTNYSDLSEYLMQHVGVSEPKYICACAVDLAKYNDMTLGELFENYEG